MRNILSYVTGTYKLRNIIPPTPYAGLVTANLYFGKEFNKSKNFIFVAYNDFVSSFKRNAY